MKFDSIESSDILYYSKTFHRCADENSYLMTSQWEKNDLFGQFIFQVHEFLTTYCFNLLKILMMMYHFQTSFKSLGSERFFHIFIFFLPISLDFFDILKSSLYHMILYYLQSTILDYFWQ